MCLHRTPFVYVCVRISICCELILSKPSCLHFQTNLHAACALAACLTFLHSAPPSGGATLLEVITCQLAVFLAHAVQPSADSSPTLILCINSENNLRRNEHMTGSAEVSPQGRGRALASAVVIQMQVIFTIHDRVSQMGLINTQLILTGLFLRGLYDVMHRDPFFYYLIKCSYVTKCIM